ncbi:MAG: hypothetical protein OEZ34_09385 [Spirochaetia bacterium]|nr:hypothetical protein [Spirochaetia bacterium]
MSEELQKQIMERLRLFLEVHNKTKIPEAQAGALKMHIAHCRSNQKTKKKDIIINFLLERMENYIFKTENKSEEKTEIIVSFIMEELEEFYRNKLKQ